MARLGDRSPQEILDSLDLNSTALSYAEQSGIKGMALNGPPREFAENMFRAKVLSMRPQINSALTQAGTRADSNLGGRTDSGISERATQDVHGRVFSAGAQALSESAMAASDIQDRASSAYMGVLSQVDSMALQAQLQREQMEANEPDFLDRMMQIGTLGVSLISPLGNLKASRGGTT